MLGMTIDVTIWARLRYAPGCRMVVAKQEDDAPRRARCQFKSPTPFVVDVTTQIFWPLINDVRENRRATRWPEANLHTPWRSSISAGGLLVRLIL